jgi:polygalacturonase
MRITDISLLNASEWSIRLKECDGVFIRGVNIYAYVNQNNDGIDIDAKNVVISDCIVDCEDDAICLKSDHPNFLVENITITNCIVATNCNAFKFGTASYCGFKNVSISNCVVRRPSEAGKIPPRSILKGCNTDTIGEIGIALEIVDGGIMDQVTISNITMTGIQTPLFIRLGNRGGLARRLHANPETAEYGKLENAVPGTLKNVIISNICATVETMVSSSITGIPGSYVENVVIKNVIFNIEGAGTLVEVEKEVPEKIAGYPQAHMLFGYSMPAYGLYARHVKGLVLDNFIFNLKAPDARPALMLDDCHNVRISNFDVDKPTEGQPLLKFIRSSNIEVSGYRSPETQETFLSIEGDVSSNIRLINNDFSNVTRVSKFSEGASKSSVIKSN